MSDSNLESRIKNKISELSIALKHVADTKDVKIIKDTYLKKYLKSLYSELKNISSVENKKILVN